MPQDVQNRLRRGTAPLLISVPHAGTALPPGLAERMTSAGRALPDTDWYVDRLYAFAGALGAGLLVAGLSRYAVDLNRPPDDAPLYAGATTGLVPTETFAGESIYRDGHEPGEGEFALRIQRYWTPYHQVLSTELDTIRERHGYAVLLDAHSIAGEVPRLFEGELPALNLGSNRGCSADAGLIAGAERRLRDSAFSTVLDGRFRGGHITRHYGQPSQRVHALQLEIAQRSYMREKPPEWNGERAERLQSVLEQLVGFLVRWSPDDR